MVDIMTWLADRSNKRKKAGYPYKMQDIRLQMYLSSLWTGMRTMPNLRFIVSPSLKCMSLSHATSNG